jgi:iron(III) transport system permease protein
MSVLSIKPGKNPVRERGMLLPCLLPCWYLCRLSQSWSTYLFLLVMYGLICLQPFLPDYVKNSIWLILGVGTGVFILGVGTAWLVTMCRFPGQRIFNWALILPMAVPAYLMAYTYTEFFSFTGPVQSVLRDLMGWGPGDYWFPDIRSVQGAILMMSFVFYPYVYLLSRSAFLEQSVSLMEASRSLGCSPFQSFYKIALPLARPSIAGGMALALMENAE